jgi:hypothetical protein
VRVVVVAASSAAEAPEPGLGRPQGAPAYSGPSTGDGGDHQESAGGGCVHHAGGGRGGTAIAPSGRSRDLRHWGWGVSRGGETRQNRAPHAAVDAYATVLSSSRDWVVDHRSCDQHGILVWAKGASSPVR